MRAKKQAKDNLKPIDTNTKPRKKHNPRLSNISKIEKNVPIPDDVNLTKQAGQRGTSLIPWDDLQVNDSFAVPAEHKKTIAQAIGRLRKERGWEFLWLRAGTRVWRVK